MNLTESDKAFKLRLLELYNKPCAIRDKRAVLQVKEEKNIEVAVRLLPSSLETFQSSEIEKPFYNSTKSVTFRLKGNKN